MNKITLHKAVGTGKTELSAFDSALLKCGIGNANLIYLSSVIPPNTDLIFSEESVSFDKAGGWGDRLYVVMAQKRTTKRGSKVAAGIGWVQNEETKKGLFVEHAGDSEEGVIEHIEASLSSMVNDRPNESFGSINYFTAGAECFDDPVCVMAVAVYKSVRW